MLPFVQPTDAYGQISDNFLPETDYVDARVLAADISNGSASRVGDPNGTNIIVTPADNISVIATGVRIVTATFWGG